MKIFTTLFFFLLHTLVYSNHVEPIYRQTDKADTIPRELIYDLPLFKEGTIFLKDGTSDKYLCNYNRFLKEMQILSDIGDTLKLTEPFLIEKVVIDSLVYYYDKGYLRQLKANNEYKLAEKRNIIFTMKEEVIRVENIDFKASSIKGGTFMYLSSYYIGDKYNHFIRANRKAFLRLFSKKKDLQTYLLNKSIDFKKEDDLFDLFSFCTQ